MHVCVCVRPCVCACTCVRTCVRACVCVCVLVILIIHAPSPLQVVLDDFSLTIPAGKVTALCGLSGAGQLGSESTLGT